MFVRRVFNGVLGGLAGGIVFGMMMGMMGMLPMIGRMAGMPSLLGGFLVHMVMSAMIGGGFGAVLGSGIVSMAGGVRRGLFYGAGWWVLGPLTMMPLMMGMGFGANWNVAAVVGMLPSLMGHLVFGAVLGVTFASLSERQLRLSDPVLRGHSSPR